MTSTTTESKTSTRPDTEVKTTSTLLSAKATEGETDEAKAKRQKAVRDSYAAAEKRLREAHLDEFNGYHKEEAADRGYDWTPPLTKEEKAEAQLRELLANNPGLAEKIGAQA